MRRTQLIGLLLWRGGILTVAIFISVEAARALLSLWQLPTMLEIALGLMSSGALLVFGSVVLERIRDYRAENNR